MNREVIMKFNLITPVLAIGLIAVTACGHKKHHHKKDHPAPAPVMSSYKEPITQDSVNMAIESWPESSKNAVSAMITKYGLPSAVTNEALGWGQTTSFKNTMVFKDEVKHSFPAEHHDVLLQTIDYRVPTGKVGALTEFDGSLIIDRTKGQLSARNEREEMNYLAFNLADKIVRNEMSVEEARLEYSKGFEALESGNTSNKNLSALNFKTAGKTADEDRALETSTKIMQAQEARKVFEDSPKPKKKK